MRRSATAPRALYNGWKPPAPPRAFLVGIGAELQKYFDHREVIADRQQRRSVEAENGVVDRGASLGALFEHMSQRFRIPAFDRALESCLRVHNL
jgi:hypothetical protein